MKKILFLLVLVLLLASCHSGSETIMLVSENGMEIYTKGYRTSSLVTLDASTVEGICFASSLSPQQVAKRLVPEATSYYAEPDSYDKRKRLYLTLQEVTGAESVPDLWKGHQKELKDSKFLDSLASESNGFDAALDKLVEDSKYRFDIYRSEDVLAENCDYASAIVFLKRWIKAIIG